MASGMKVRNTDQGEENTYILTETGTYYFASSGADSSLPVATRVISGGPMYFEGLRYVAATGFNVFD